MKVFESFVNNYINNLTGFLTDIKTGDIKSANVDRVKWHQNIDTLAEYLSNLNPSWDSYKWKGILYDHLNLIEKDAISRFSSNCTTGLDYQGEIKSDILNAADYMANGIIQQFKI
jgi:hypothetical protein